MNERYEELVRRAVISGDAAALDQLMALGQQHEADGRFQDASKVFRAAAGAYRTRADEGERHAMLVHSIYQKWFDAPLCELRDWSSRMHKIDGECIRKVIVDQLWGNEQYNPIFTYLEEVLTALGMQFYSPGGSVPRRVWVLLAELFGLEKRSNELSKYLDNKAVRLGLDLLASEVVNRCGAGAAGEP
ncbi:MAG: hypothetical protein ACRECV_18180 [Xanthobacteraceae bacterium]